MMHAALPEVKAVGIDFDDFIVKSRQIKTQQHIAVAADFGIELTIPQVDAVWGSGLVYETASFYGHPDPANVTPEESKEFIKAYDSRSHEFPKVLLPGAKAAYDKIAANDLPFFMVTSLTRGHAQQEMEQLGLDTMELFLLDGSDTTPEIKPKPGAFANALRILDTYGIEPASVMYGGDALSDAKASEAAGLQFLGVPSGAVSAAGFAAGGEYGYATVPTINGFADRVLERAGLVSVTR